MKCDKFQGIAGQLARNEIMDADERAQALAHAEICKRCDDVLAAQNNLSDSLRSLAEDTKAAYPVAALEEKVLRAFRERTKVVSISASSGRRRYWAAAAAAVVLLAFGIAVWRWHVASVQRQNQASSRQTPLPANDPGRDAPPAAPVNQTSPPKSLIAAGPRRAKPRRQVRTKVERPEVARQPEASSVPATPTETQEVVTHFVSLGYGNAFDLQDGVQMVRVDLPRSALARFGLPMNMDRADERIKADVLVGADGLARAIRFVQPADQSTIDLKPGNERNEQ